MWVGSDTCLGNASARTGPGGVGTFFCNFGFRAKSGPTDQTN